MNEYYDQLLNTQDLLNAKEQEIFLYINSHEIPDKLRDILGEWASLKTRYSEIGTQYINKQKQEIKSRELEREAFKKEYEEKLKAIKSHSKNEVTETLKQQFNDNIEVEYQGRIYDIPSEAYLTTNHDEFTTVHLLQDSQWVKLLTVDEFNKLDFQ